MNILFIKLRIINFAYDYLNLDLNDQISILASGTCSKFWLMIVEISDDTKDIRQISQLPLISR